MKKFTILLTALSLFAVSSINATAQTALTTAVDFTVTDLEGNEHNLFTYLDAGKYVCIDFFAYWCGPCQSTAPEFTTVYHQYGCNAGDVIFLSLEYEGTDAITHDFEVSYAGENPPPAASGVDGGAAAPHAAYGIAAFPTYILIAPDHSIVEQDIWPMDATILDGVLQSYNLDYMDCTNGVEETAAEFSVYPVPANDVLTVEVAELGANIEVINMLGEVVLTSVANSNKVVFETQELSVGTYMVRTTLNSDVKTKSIQIVR